MLWLERPPFLRWLGAGLLVTVAAWAELAPPTTAESVFLVEDVTAGTPLEEHHVERRPVRKGVLSTVEPRGVAALDLRAGDPLIESMIAEVAIPSGWMVIEAAVPSHASPGASARAVIVGGGVAPVEFPAMVVDMGRTDPFGDTSGSIAVADEWIGPAAAASSDGRLVIGVDSPGR